MRLHKLKYERGLSRDFTFFGRWSEGDDETVEEPLGMSIKPNNAWKSRRKDWQIHDPFAGHRVQLRRLAARVKESSFTQLSMEDLDGDHNARWGGWHKLRWNLICTCPRGMDTDAGNGVA